MIESNHHVLCHSFTSVGVGEISTGFEFFTEQNDVSFIEYHASKYRLWSGDRNRKNALTHCIRYWWLCIYIYNDKPGSLRFQLRLKKCHGIGPISCIEFYCRVKL